MNRRRWIALVAVIVVVAVVRVTLTVVVVGRARDSRAAPSLPGSMASAGDSITRAFNVDRDHVLQDGPSESWSTGTDPLVGSHYDRILRAHPAIAGHVYNDAQSGAKMAALAGQLSMAAAQHVDYVTVLMGANDLCTPTVATMTPTASFKAQFDRALSTFFAADAGAHVLVASIPDLFQLWESVRTNVAAEVIWGLGHLCQSLLSPTDTTTDRQRVAAQEQADNAALASVCHRYRHCRFDGYAVNRLSISAGDVSQVDYFHPGPFGQIKLAALTWGVGYWASTR